MPFTDEDLRVLKAMTQAGDWPVSGKSLQSLLARLEYSEELNGAWEDLQEEEISFDDLMAFRNRWRKSKGE